MYCKSCGNQLPDGSVKCQYCGADQAPKREGRSPYETGETPVAFNPPPVAPQTPDTPEKKGTKGILIGIIVALFVALLAVLFIFVIKPKIDEKKNPNSAESTTNINATPVIETTTVPPIIIDESRTGNAEKTTKRESVTNKEKTSKKSESEKTNTNNRKENTDKNINDDNAVTLPPQIDTNTQQTKLEESHEILYDLLYTIEWGTEAEVDSILKNNLGLVYSDPDDKLFADVIKSTIPYFTYEIWGYEQIDENTYNFFIDIYTVDFYDVSEDFAYEVLAYADELYWYGYEPTDEELEAKFTELYLAAFDYNDHDSVYTSTYITMSYVNGKWQIDSVADICNAMLCEYDTALEYAEEIIYEGLQELEDYYEYDVYYDDDYEEYI